MDKQKRHVGSIKQRATPPKKKSSHESRLTVMIIRSLGKVHSFKIAPHFVLIAALFVFLYVVASIFLINRYFDLRQVNVIESKKIKTLESEVFKSKKIIYRSEQHVALLEDYIRNLEEQPEQKPAPTTKAESLEPTSTPRPAEQVSIVRKEGDQEKESITAVDVIDMAIQKEDTKLVVDFKLVKAQAGEEGVGGYIHIIALGENVDPPAEWSFPRERLENGVPINFRHGQRFLIQKFKPIHGEFYWAPNSEPPTTMKVLVYDRAGKLMLEKKFQLRDKS